MGRKSRKRKAPSEKAKGPTEAAKAEVDEAKPVLTKEPIQTVTPKNAEEAAVSAVRQFYDKLIQLPLDEKAPSFYSHYLITSSTLERMGKSCHVRAEKNGFILQDVLETVQQKPDLLVVFCNLLQEIYIAAELAQLIKDKYDEEVVNLKDTATHNTASTKTGPATFEKFLQGKGVIVVLVLLLAVALAPWYTTKHQIPRPGPHSGKTLSLPDLPTAFTGRSDEIHRLIYHVMTEHVSIVAVTGGPGYGKSSVAIVSSHELLRLGIPVYYVSLSEVKSIETFVMAFLHATDKRKTDQMPDRQELLSWVSALQTKTVVVLDNVDLLTLRETDLKNEFQKLLKDVVAVSARIHLVVATRYRFIIANDFEEIHLNPLTSAEAVTLLKRVLVPQGQTSNRKIGSLEDEHLKEIANKTGGIPLAVKVVGILVKSGIVSTTQVLEELAMDPLHTFSRDSVSPDEQLNRCFNLSYKYLSPIMRKCLIYASRFPGTFDRQAREAIITIMTGDAHCLDQLVDRSLVEYSTVEERYTMHSLLRTFVANSVIERLPKHRYFRLFCNHYILLLSIRVTGARFGGDVNVLYSTITADYHNFLHLLHIYTSESREHPFMAPKEMLLLANHTFDVMKSKFPMEPLMDWWTTVLRNICSRMHASEFELLAPHFLQLSTKFGNLLLYHKQYKLAGDVLLFADQCVYKDTALAVSFITCQHPQADSYTHLLLALMKVHEEDGMIDRAFQVRERLHFCIDSAPDKKPEDLISDDFCTAGISYLQEKHSKKKSIVSALQLFDAHFNCFSLLEEQASRLTSLLEDAFDYEIEDVYSENAGTKALRIAKRCNLVERYRQEAKWLAKSVKVLELLPSAEMLLFLIHFRLIHLHWLLFDDAEKAVEHGRIAYSLAIKYPNMHTVIWKASIRLGDMYHQIDGSQSKAGFYFEEALKHSPFVNADPDFIYQYQHFTELHLISIHFHAGEHDQCMQHYGQWANLEIASASNQARKIVDALFSEPANAHGADGRSLAVMDSSLNWLNANIAKRFLNAFMQKAQSSTLYYSRIIASIFVTIGTVLMVLIYIMCTSMVFACISFVTLLFTRIADFIFLYHFRFHYFLYIAVVEHRIWSPRQFLQLPRVVTWIYAIALIFFTVMSAIIAGLTSFLGLYLFTEQVVSVYSPSSLYHNMSMSIDDIDFYDHVY